MSDEWSNIGKSFRKSYIFFEVLYEKIPITKEGLFDQVGNVSLEICVADDRYIDEGADHREELELLGIVWTHPSTLEIKGLFSRYRLDRRTMLSM